MGNVDYRRHIDGSLNERKRIRAMGSRRERLPSETETKNKMAARCVRVSTFTIEMNIEEQQDFSFPSIQ